MTTATVDRTSLHDALATALASLLHEDADPDCTGQPSYFDTKAQAESLVERAFQTPIVQNAVEKPYIQAFVNGDIIEAAPDEWREVYYEPCPTPAEKHCDSEYHHYGRGDHLVPLDPDWSPS
jgi:hypothetical protein